MVLEEVVPHEGMIVINILPSCKAMSPVIVSTLEEGKGVGDRYFRELCLVRQYISEDWVLLAWKDRDTQKWQETLVGVLLRIKESQKVEKDYEVFND